MNLNIITPLFVAVVALTSPASGAEPSDRFEPAIRTFMTTAGAPAVSVAISKDSEVIYSRAFGLADVENSVPATRSSVFRIASVSKPLTATAVLQLVDAGRIDLDAPIQKYVPSFPDRYQGVTVRDLLRHTGGIRHYKGDEFASTRHCGSLAEGMEIFAGDAMANAPRAMITYSSYGYVLLGLAIESVSGMPYSEYVRRRILGPARMTRTRVDDIHAVVANRAAGYRRGSDGSLERPDLVDTSCRVPAGGFLSTAEDLARFGTALLSGRLLPERQLSEMMKSQLTAEIVSRTLAALHAPPDFHPPGLGFGWSIGTAKHPDAVLHGGNQQGATAMLYLIPKRSLVIAILTNIEGEGDRITTLADDLADEVK